MKVPETLKIFQVSLRAGLGVGQGYTAVGHCPNISDLHPFVGTCNVDHLGYAIAVGTTEFGTVRDVSPHLTTLHADSTGLVRWDVDLHGHREGLGLLHGVPPV